MAKVTKEKEKITVVAELSVTHDGVSETVKSFDTAWHRRLELGPVTEVKFLGFVRKD